MSEDSRRITTLHEALVIGAYREWSEENYCAGFESPTPEIVTRFKNDLLKRRAEDYEETFLRMWSNELAEIEGREEFVRENAIAILAERDSKILRQRLQIFRLLKSIEGFRSNRRADNSQGEGDD